jgi:class 3 adenylate cyclase/predicted ATPase
MSRPDSAEESIAEWLQDLGFRQYAESFRRNAITWELLSELSDQDLRELGVSALGHRKQLLKAIASLCRENGTQGTISSTAVLQRAQAERRQITVLFCDLVDSVPLSLRFDPEDLSEILSAFQSCCDGVIRRFGGYVAGFTGDGLKVFFGFPRATEHDPEQAVRAGLALAAAVGALQIRSGLTLSIRVSVATGDVVVGEVTGSAEVYERTVVGEPPNLAARLLPMGEPGSVVISDQTKNLVGRMFDYEDMGLHHLKGFPGPRQAWRVLKERRLQGRFEATRAEHLTSLIGRTGELMQLQQLWSKTKRGEGQVLLLSGEPGVGKSRLTLAFLQRLQSEAFVPLCFYGFPYYQNSSLYPIIAQLYDAARFSPEDSSDLKLEKLEGFLSELTPELRDIAPLFASLLSIPSEGRYAPLSFTPQQQKRHTLNALESHVGALARRKPVLMVFEDLQWMDPSTLEFVERLMEGLRHLPVLIVATYRSDFTPSFGRHPHAVSLAIPRLSRNDSMLLVETLLSKLRLQSAVLHQILDHSDGVPLFLEELTKASLEATDEQKNKSGSGGSGTALPVVRVPRTLQDSLVARMDRLVAWKEIVQTAAVIGRRFSIGMLANLLPRDKGSLPEALQGLVQAEILVPLGDTPEGTYAFKHALMQEAANATLLRSERSLIHERIVRVLQERFPGTVNNEPELLAFHCSGAGLVEPAIGYWRRAAERALRQWANLEAVAHIKQALGLLATQPGSKARDSLELDLQTSLGATLTTVEGFAAPEVATAYERARALSSDSYDAAQKFSVMRGLWVYDLVRAEWSMASALAEEMLTVARGSHEAGYELEAHRALGITLAWRGDLGRGYDHLQQGYRIYNSQQHQGHAIRYGNDPGVACLIHAAFVLWLLGYPERALTTMHEGLALARRVAHPFSIAQALVYLAFIHQFRGEPEPIQGITDEAKALAVEHGFAFWLAESNIMAGWARCAQKDTETGLAQLRNGIGQFLQTGARMDKPRWLAILAEASDMDNRIQETLGVISEALEVAQSTGECIFEPRLHQLKGDLLLKQGRPNAAGRVEASFHKALEKARSQQAKSWELRAATSIARFWHEGSRRRQAYDLLAPVYASFTEGFDTLDLRTAKALLDDLAG